MKNICNSGFKNVIVIGTGEVVAKRVRPSLQLLVIEGLIERICYCDLHQKSPFKDHTAAEFYCPVTTKGLDLKNLSRLDFLGQETLVLVCTSTAYHAFYAKQAYGHVGRIAVEKPLTDDITTAEALLPLEDTVYPIGHQLFKQEMLDLTKRFANKTTSLSKIARAEFDLLETRGIDNRQVDPATWDVGWHGLECLLAPIRKQDRLALLELHRTFSGSYTRGNEQADVSTLTRIEGAIGLEDRQIPFVIRAGKAVATEQKTVRFYDDQDRIVDEASLSESGSDAHERLIRELLSPGEPDMQLDLDHVIEVVIACESCTFNSIDCGTYEFGCTPSWMNSPVDLSLPVG
ncbi:hypothetical protein [Gimesia chilikensis]|uniref:Glucose-6-phosphate 1-dehydrogenase n=1 Tax=Gimesia chilikensis TaxID=2605989 RepID=A0A517PSX3_9PLAN|nr:hypothetical protein [Gimesia chilikensis]QDT22476.1 Glucose-6-phosphate 1-dehydrogenase [Gimesia chilikensis]